MDIVEQSERHRASILAALSSPFEDEVALRAARAVVRRPDVEEAVLELYPGLVQMKTITHALRHLERAGGDLDSILIPWSVFAAEYPLNRILPMPPPQEAGRVTLASIRDGLERHQGLLEEVIADMAAAAGPERLILGKGQAYRARLPGYRRYTGDVDVYVPSWEEGLNVLGALCNQLGFSMHGCKVGVASALKCFRHTRGHELNVAIHTGGVPSPFLALPFRVRVADPARAAMVMVGGSSILACSPEDLLLSSAIRTLRDAPSTGRALGDVRYLLAREGSGLDWGYIVEAARADGLESSLRKLVLAAQRADGLEMLSPDQIADLATDGDGPTASGPSGIGRLGPRALENWRWLIRYASTRLGPVRGPAHALLERSQLHLLRREIRLRRSGRPARRVLAGLFHTLRPRFRSLCELRSDSAPEELGFCLSRVSRDPKASGPARALVPFLPDRAQERSLRKRTTVGDIRAQPHRCEAFLVNRAEPS